MANNEHSSLANDQLHNPKDFSTASNETYPTKDSSGNLTWADNKLNRTHFVAVGGYLNKATTDEYAQDYSNGTAHTWHTVVTDPTADAQDAVKASILYCTKAGFVNSWNGVVAISNGESVNFKLYKGTPVDDSNAAIDLTQLGTTITETGEGGTSAELIVGTGFGSTQTFAAGDVLIATMQPTVATSTQVYLNSTIEVVYNS